MQAARADGLSFLVDGVGVVSNALDRIGGEGELHAFGGEQVHILLGQGRMWLQQNALKVLGGERLKLNANRQTALQLRD